MEEDQEQENNVSNTEIGQQPTADADSQQNTQNKASVASELASKIKETAIKEAAAAIKKKIVASAFWSVVGPYIVPVLIGIVVILVIGLGLALLLKGGKGYFGASASQPLSYSSSLDLTSIKEVLQKSVIIGNADPKSWYFSQVDPKFNTEFLKGKWRTCEPKLSCAGCAFTSLTMALRYYGVTNITPVDVANKNAEISGGSLNFNPDTIKSFIDKNFLQVKYQRLYNNEDKRKYWTMDMVKKSIDSGNPMLVGGNQVCGSSGEHWVLIVGYSNDLKNIVISDPAKVPRGSAARFCPASELNANIFKGYVFSKNL